ncbi:MAG TPA: 6,7-dimethyl-8-ribityllumazine synthase [Verrucomicrobiales bacterium]|jgi:6,7-dimethyl-8-ribityllumazine synthase|nr:6,7-dimethyl-8-ribityllumazine synthase [Verrucomicrobiales bacterium]HIL71312.1 6,7-dimethyl-8-ribityllumazine synthase [Verrucomicrobiota bacterium]
MLRKNSTGSKRKQKAARGGRFALVASRYNSKYVNSMLRAARKKLSEANAEKVKVIRVPGAFEIPVVVSKLAAGSPAEFDAYICLGVVLRGQTSHAQHISESVTQAFSAIQVRYHVPIIHEVLLLESRQQAEDRCLSSDHNRGVEAAMTALEMVRVLRSI